MGFLNRSGLRDMTDVSCVAALESADGPGKLRHLTLGEFDT